MAVGLVTVAELIAELSKAPQEAEVRGYDMRYGDTYPYEGFVVEDRAGRKVVVL
jgi:hypothetical protein